MSKINSTMRNHLKDIISSLCKIKKDKHISALDIGCNDGTLLNFYSKILSKQLKNKKKIARFNKQN